MGSSFVYYNGNGFWSKDICLRIWLEALVREIARLPSSFEWLTLAQQHWHEEAVWGPMGCVDPDVDRFVTTDERKQALLTLSEQAIAALAAYGEVIPYDVLNAMLIDETIRPPERWFDDDVPPETFLVVGRAFVRLLNGDTASSLSNKGYYEVIADSFWGSLSTPQENTPLPEIDLSRVSEPNEEVWRYILADQLINAIKAYREQTGAGLRESKAVIDRLRETLRQDVNKEQIIDQIEKRKKEQNKLT